jgi:hypothetical protein
MRISKTPAPGNSLQVISLSELIEFHLDVGIQQPQLHEQFVRHRGRFGKSQDRWKQVRKIKVEVPEGLHKLLDGRGFGVRQIDLIVQLLAEGTPVEFNEGMFLGDFTDDLVRDASAFAEPSEMQLLHFSAAAHVVHQVVGVPFAANKSHRSSPANPLDDW